MRDGITNRVKIMFEREEKKFGTEKTEFKKVK
jgi:hypothetical protein